MDAPIHLGLCAWLSGTDFSSVATSEAGFVPCNLRMQVPLSYQSFDTTPINTCVGLTTGLIVTHADSSAPCTVNIGANPHLKSLISAPGARSVAADAARDTHDAAAKCTRPRSLSLAV